jgi:uncharacterized membrane protein
MKQTAARPPTRILARILDRLLSDPYRLLLLVLALVYVIIFTRLAWDAHAGMRTHKADLGQIDQAVWNSSRGRLLEQTDNGFTAARLTDHVEPILVLISPIFWLWDDVRGLLLLQVIAAAAGVIPLYHLGLRRCEALLSGRQRDQIWLREPLQQLARPLAFALGVAYLLAPQLQSALLTEFHAAPLAVPLIPWAFWAVDARRWGQVLVAAVLVALVKEEMALLAAGIGLWAAWRAWWDGRHAERGADMFYGIGAGLAALLLGLAWFYVATFVIVPAYAQPLYGAAESTYFQRYGALGDTSADILRSLVSQPQVVWSIASEGPRVAYFVGLLVAFAFFPLIGFELVLLSLPLLLANLLSAYPAQYYGEFHYSAPLVPYFAAAAAYGLARLWRPLARRADRSSAAFQHLPAAGTGTMAAVAMVQNSRTALRPLLTWALVAWLLVWAGGNYLLHGRGPLGGRYDPTPILAHHSLLDRFTAQIPPDAALTATAAVHPHVSHRQYIYQFPLGLDAPVPADWALLDVTTNTDMAPGDLKAKVDSMLAADWGVVDAADGFLLLSKAATNKEASKEIPAEFYTFVRPHQAGAAGDQPWQLLGVEAEDWPRWRQTKLVAAWQVGKEFDPAADAPRLSVVTPGGDTVATLAAAAPPGLAWLPATAWRPGNEIRLTTLALALPPMFAVQASGDAATGPAVFVRGPHDTLRRVAEPGRQAEDLGAALQPYLGALAASREVTATLPDGRQLSLRGWLPVAPVAAEQPANVLLEWQLEGTPDNGVENGWPQDLAAFVHLRHAGSNVDQADGAPQWFGAPARPIAASGRQGTAQTTILNDWRQVTVPAGVEPGEDWRVVVGLYNPQSGERLPLYGGGQGGQAIDAVDELELGWIRVAAPPQPDQACALLPATCASQQN